MTLGALGVVYGDIGTSPLYALKEVFHAGHVPVTPENILGVLSLIFWTMTVVVSFKYVLLILRADNNGEGGLIAMLALATHAVRDKPRLHGLLMTLGIFGTAIFFGDAVITPAITVLGAVEGLGVYSPSMQAWVIPISLLIITGLFAVQRFGTGGIGKAFGPVTLVWFITLVALGVPHVMSNHQVLAALNPAYALGFILAQPWIAFIALGAVVLVVTGGEALYADMGHFGKRPIRIAWYCVVAPALVVNYFGQGALLLNNPEAVKNPFYMMAPAWAEIPVLVLATAAAVIASQALITAAFSVTKQAVQMGLLPRMRIIHTSVRDLGQIYVPAINWGLFVLVFFAIGLFKSSSALASAYGIAVTLDMSITTVMTFFVIRYGWKYSLPLAVAATVCFLAIDLTFFASNMLKFVSGGWFPVLLGFGMFTLMMTWREGRVLMAESMRAEAMELGMFLESLFLSPPMRVAGTAVFLSAEPGITPNALLHNLKHNKVLHDHNLFVTVRHHDIPWVGFDKRIEMEALGHDCWQVSLHFGFKNDPDVPEALKLLKGTRGAAGRHGDQLLPVARHRDAHHRRRHGLVAGEALRQHAPQRRGGGRLPEPARQPGRGVGVQSRDMRPPSSLRSLPPRGGSSSLGRPGAGRTAPKLPPVATLQAAGSQRSPSSSGTSCPLDSSCPDSAPRGGFGDGPAKPDPCRSWVRALRFLQDLSVSAAVAGFVAVLVGFTSSVVIVFQAAQALGATPAQLTSWMWALGLGMGGTSLGLSLWLKKPVLTAWSTPGAAVIAAGASGLTLPEAVGAFIACGLLITLAGFSGLFARVMNRIPVAIASALLAGVLTRFGMNAFGAASQQPVLVLSMLVAYLAGRRAWPRFAVPVVLLVGVAVAAVQGLMQRPVLDLALAQPMWVSPVWSAARDDRPGAAAVRGDHGLAEPSGGGGHPRVGL